MGAGGGFPCKESKNKLEILIPWFWMNGYHCVQSQNYFAVVEMDGNKWSTAD